MPDITGQNRILWIERQEMPGLIKIKYKKRLTGVVNRSLLLVTVC